MELFKLPESYFQRPDIKLYFVQCSKCKWDESEDAAYGDVNDVLFPIECPECKSDVFTIASDYFEV